ncbi:hypothetical protein Q9L58_000334 [Maublancomyces gigas]|uniref:Uncharacterized protein n=1 Tax=Discina gigas TaxID=1032678 RepID=A0ABR3GXH9_9PEZI
MPSRSNPNVPTSVKNRARSRKAGLKAAVKARPAIASTDPDRPVTKAGVHHQKTNSSKTVRRITKRSQYAITRKEAAMEEVRKAGEGGVVEMKDVTVVRLSRRQEKLATRAVAVAEANAKAATAKKAEAVEKALKVEKEAAEAEAVMDID